MMYLWANQATNSIKKKVLTKAMMFIETNMFSLFKINHLYQVKKHSTDPFANQKDVSHLINCHKIF